MGVYQFFRMDRAGARGDAASVSLPDDAAAIRMALSQEYRDGCELWDGFRFIGRFYGPDACRAPEPTARTDGEDLIDSLLDAAATPSKTLVH